MKHQLVVVARHYAGLCLWHTGDLLDRALDVCEGQWPKFERTAVNLKLSAFTMGLFDLSRRVDICDKAKP